ncbi:unnamed protein product [Trifolium pratense]|uniref:Uncharacterized protein n=1 Tax=Trifolium pratense TaxID=57577 RepID=A0ACB0K5E6_TRIPR|nr:unnamed protein product [Trifolium pratense]
MGFNTKDILLHLSKVFHISIVKSYTFMKKYPKVSCALLVFLIVYIFLSCIYNLLVFLSPFLVFIAILVKIFWSSEQTNVNGVEKKGDKKKVEVKLPEVPKNERRGMLYKYPSQNATSRRRNFTGKKLDVYGDLEQKAKNLSAAFRNEFTKKNTEIISGFRVFEKEIEPYDFKLSSRKCEDPKKQLFCEPSKAEVVTCGSSYYDGQEKKIEKMEDEKKAIEDNIISNKVIELKEDGQQKLMDLGICEIESNKRLESLIARRRARKQLTLEIENDLIETESITPSQIAPLLIAARMNPFDFDSPRAYDGIEMPGSAPSALRSPFDIPYEPFEEKPNLKGDGFVQEFIGDMPLEPKQDLEVRDQRIPNSRLSRLSGLGSHDSLEKLNSKEGSESELQAPNPTNEGEETIQEEEGQCKVDMFGMKIEEGDDGDPKNSMSYHESEPNLIPSIINIERVSTLPPKPQESIHDFPISSANVTNLNDSLYESLSIPIDKSKEHMFFANRLIRHTPSISLASDLHVEFSEIGSPTLTIDDNHEDLWEAHEVSDHDDIFEENTDVENVDDVNFLPSESDIHVDTPTYEMSSDHNMFGNVRQTGTSQYSSDVSARWKRLIRLMDTRVDHLPQETLSENLEECNQTENLINTDQVMNEVNNSAATEQDNTTDIGSNEVPQSSQVHHHRQQTVDEVSTITSSSSSSSSPRSVLHSPRKTSAGQEMPQVVQQSDVENVAQETVNVEGPVESMSQNIQPSMVDPNVESHNGDLIHSQDVTYPLENSIQESNMSSNMNEAEVRNQEDQNIKNDENNEDNSTLQSRQDASSEPHNDRNVESHNDDLIHSQDDTSPLENSIQESNMSSNVNDAEVCNHEDQNLKNDENNEDNSTPQIRQEHDASSEPNRLAEVPMISPMLESSSEIHIENNEGESLIQEASTQPFINADVVDTSSANDFEGKIHNDLNENEAKIHSSEEEKLQTESKQVVDTSFANDFEGKNHNDLNENEAKIHSSEEENYLQSESKQVVETSPAYDFEGKNYNDLNENEAKIHSSEEENHLQSESKQVVDTSSANDFEGKNQNDLNENEAKIHSSEEENCFQNESKQVVEDHIEKESEDKGNIVSKDSPLPMVTEVSINEDDRLGESDEMNKNEVTDKVSHIAHTNDHP